MESPFLVGMCLVIFALLIILIVQTFRTSRSTSSVTAVDSQSTQAVITQINEARDEMRLANQRLDERERRINEREDQCVHSMDLVRQEKEAVQQLQSELAERAHQLDDRAQSITAQLEHIAGFSVDQAENRVLELARERAQARADTLARQIEHNAQDTAQSVAKHIVVTAIQRIAAAQTSESVVTTVDIPSEEMKGRIIGKEGRNIRVFEQLTGVTVVIDDTPGTVLLSCFEPVRREIARLTLAALVADGRIHPSSIEDTYAKAVETVEENCLRAAQDALDEVGIGGVDPRLKKSIGALAYRTSFGQNVLAHSVECAQLAGAMAAELGLDVEVCKRAAFLHDIGKSVITSGDGSHAAEGAELARRFGESETVVHAIAAHHNEIPAETIEDILTQAADAISGSRPGARRESYELYVQRLQTLERVAMSKPGVDRVFAMQAGREIRVMVLPDQVDDESSYALAQQIAQDVETEVTYPGRVKVTVIRESRATAMAH